MYMPVKTKFSTRASSDGLETASSESTWIQLHWSHKNLPASNLRAVKATPVELRTSRLELNPKANRPSGFGFSDELRGENRGENKCITSELCVAKGLASHRSTGLRVSRLTSSAFAAHGNERAALPSVRQTRPFYFFLTTVRRACTAAESFASSSTVVVQLTHPSVTDTPYCSCWSIVWPSGFVFGIF